MKVNPKLWTLLVVCLLALSLAACSKSKDAQTGKSDESPSAADNTFKEHMDISMAFWDIGPAMQSPDKDEMLQYLQKRFNITIKPVPISWNDYSEKIKLWAASGEIPDVFTTNLGDSAIDMYQKWAKQGVIRALPDDMSKYPNLVEYLNSPDLNFMKVDGKFYMYPRYTYPTIDDWQTDRAIIVRKDWMDKLGISEPASFDEYVNMLSRFVNEDPDGNGSKDTIGVTAWSSGYLPVVVSDVLPQFMSGSWLKEDGKWIPYYASGKFIEALKRMRQLYAQGVLYKDFSVEKDNVEKFAQGKTGSLVYSIYPGHVKTISGVWSKYNDKPFTESVAFLKPWKGSDGNAYHFSYPSFWSESYFSGKVNDEKMDRILRLYDFLQSGEGRRMLDYGLEGKDYTLSGDTVTVTRGKNDKGEYAPLMDKYPSLNVWLFLVSWAQEKDFIVNDTNKSKYGEDILKMSNDAKDWLTNNTKTTPSNFDVNAIALQHTIPGIMVGDDWVKVVVGKQDPEQMWKDVLKDYEKKGLNQLIDTVNKEAAARGIQ